MAIPSKPRRSMPLPPVSSEAPDKPYEALIRLWVLRMLVQQGGAREFINSYGYKSDEKACPGRTRPHPEAASRHPAA
jgi:hypothetical protein